MLRIALLTISLACTAGLAALWLASKRTVGPDTCGAWPKAFTVGTTFLWIDISRDAVQAEGGVAPQPGLIEFGYQWPSKPHLFRVVAYRHQRLGDFEYTKQVMSYTDSAGVQSGTLLRVVLPLWVLLLACGLYPAIVLLREPMRRSYRRRRGLCAGCGYNLAGNQSGTCPECGREAGVFRVPLNP